MRRIWIFMNEMLFLYWENTEIFNSMGLVGWWARAQARPSIERAGTRQRIIPLTGLNFPQTYSNEIWAIREWNSTSTAALNISYRHLINYLICLVIIIKLLSRKNGKKWKTLLSPANAFWQLKSMGTLHCYVLLKIDSRGRWFKDDMVIYCWNLCIVIN